MSITVNGFILAVILAAGIIAIAIVVATILFYILGGEIVLGMDIITRDNDKPGNQ